MNINSTGKIDNTILPTKSKGSSKNKNTDVQSTGKSTENVDFDFTTLSKKIKEALESTTSSVINKAKVDAISKELGAGTYSIDPVRLAEIIIDSEIGN